MSTPPPNSRRALRQLLIGLLLGVVASAVVFLAVNGILGRSNPPPPAAGTTAGPDRSERAPTASVELEGDPDNHTLRVPATVREGLRIAEGVPARAPDRSRPLVMPGSTALDPGRMARIRTRFNAEIVEIRQVNEPSSDPGTAPSVVRELRSGDRVRKGDTLAVVWSIDVGGMKSNLVDALVQTRLDERRLKAREELYKSGSIPEDTLNQTRRDVITDRSAADRAERTLRTWNVPDAEIRAVYEESEQILGRGGKRDREKERLWARSELTSPIDGTVVERNVSRGEYVADNTVNLFTIADVSYLLVLANPPEDLLPTLVNLKPAGMRWSVKTVGAPEIDGHIDEIGYILDANQHTAVVKGYVPNRDGRLRAGQFVSATVQLPPPDDVVEVPLTALAEDGAQSFVFVQEQPGEDLYTMRRVQVSHRFQKTAWVQSKLSRAEQELTPEEEARGLWLRRPLKKGELYLPTGVLELRAALEAKEAKAKQARAKQSPR
jgi:cobalt-zinc-cadmium efflux system membrane fusion protein